MGLKVKESNHLALRSAMIFGKNKSLACFKANPNASFRLLCFPCAGSGASMYRRWADSIPTAEVWAVNYPGRESLHSEPMATNVAHIIEPVLASSSSVADKPIVIYGHSFGSLVGFLVALELQKAGFTVSGLCVSARRAPHLEPALVLSDLSDDEFLKQLDELGGMPDAIRSSQEMMDFYLPVIKADLHLNDSTLHSSGSRVDCPIYLFSATDDKAASREELDAWRHATSSRFDHKVFEGGHFFIQDQQQPFLANLNRILAILSQEDEADLIAF